MKKKVLRCLAVVAIVGVLSGCGKQEYSVTHYATIPTEKPHDNITYEVKTIQKSYYTPSDDERQFAYLAAYAMTHDEDPIIQTMGTNVAINIAKEQGMNLIEVFTVPNLFSGIHDGVPSIEGENEEGISTWIPVTEDMLTDELKEAVDWAFVQDYTDGAQHYYSIHSNSKLPMPEEFIQEGEWIFFKEF